MCRATGVDCCRSRRSPVRTAPGVKELFLVSENSTSYGKDLGDLALLEKVLPELCDVPGIERVRVSYLQPAEIRPGLLEAMAGLRKVMPWYDLSFQHASPTVLRRMRRFGGTEHFLRLIDGIREREPRAGIRTNVIVGFPGETESDVEELESFLVDADLDVIGVFGYSRITDLVESLTSDRAAARVGEDVVVLIDEIDDETGEPIGRAEHQGPEVDGVCILPPGSGVVGELVAGRVISSEGVDLRVDSVTP